MAVDLRERRSFGVSSLLPLISQGRDRRDPLHMTYRVNIDRYLYLLVKASFEFCGSCLCDDPLSLLCEKSEFAK